MGRYGKQPADTVLDMTVIDAVQLAKAVGDLIEEENDYRFENDR